MDNSVRQKLPHLYNDVFAKSPAGLQVLYDLHSKFADPQPKHPLDALELAFQAGQRSVINHIMLKRDQLERFATQEEQL